MKHIPLTQGQIAMVDDQDYDLLIKWKWYASYCKRGNRFYALRSIKVAGKKSEISMHRFLLAAVDKTVIIDHKDHNTLNNTRSNLRIASHAENMANKSSKRNGSSKFLGVYKIKNRDTWVAQINKNGKRKKLGCFKNEEEAAKAYDNAALEAFGQFANVNFKSVFS